MNSKLRHSAGQFLDAVRFLTILPVPPAKTEVNLAGSMFFFPAVGILIGMISLLVFSVAHTFFNDRIAALALVATPILISGGLHLDGLADFCDGFFGGSNQEEKLRIMKDSRIGTWGAAAVVFLILAKWELLVSLPNRASFFLMAMACSRWMQVLLSFALPYIGKQGGLGESVAAKVGTRELAGASLFLLPVFLLTGIKGLPVFLVFLFFAAGIYFFFKRKMGGITGDMLGAASEASELVIFMLPGVYHA